MHHTNAIDNVKDEAAARKKFESFKLGKGLPSNAPRKHAHVRSHSRNASISSSVSSLSLSVSSKPTTSPDMPCLSNQSVNPAPPSKRNSHHRRRSSVSTRIESAEMMGVSIPDLPPSTSEDNINLGEKDSIRRRALWALEGKPDVSFSKVEIPELSTPVMEKMMFDFATKPSAAQNAVPSYGSSIGSLMSNKRDSFKLLASSSSSKDQLHTLVEEEEEEEDDSAKPQEITSTSAPAAPPTPITPGIAVTKATPVRPRPTNLNLRPLSLTPENLVSNISGLPTPSLTPSPRAGLKSLALVPSPTPSTDDAMNVTTKRQASGSRRLSLSLTLAACESPTPNSTASSEDSKNNRRSSISYKSASNGVTTNFAGLPTPEMTPTSFERRYSIADSLRRSSTSSSGDEDFFPTHSTQSRPLSASEQHFLFKSHNALLARITDLERALSVRRRSSGGFSNNGSSRPVSVASDFSSSSEYGSSEPSDEMLRLVADLKAERDELKRDVDGWRMRIGDMEKQLGVVAGRVESERRDAWVARSMAGLLEVEKGALERKLEGVEKTVVSLEEEKQALQQENEEVKKKVTSLEEELEGVRQELAEERKAKEEAIAASAAEVLATPTPRTPEPRSRPVGFTARRNLWFNSVDSTSTLADVEDSCDDSNPKINFSLKAVAEDNENEDAMSKEENGLAGYEDEEDSDVSFRSSSSFGSEDDFPRSVAHLQVDAPVSVAPRSGSVTPRPVSPPAIHEPRPTHASRASLSKTWTFPKGALPSNDRAQREPEVDRFFECLQEDDSDSNGSAPVSPSAYSYEKSKGLFASGFKYASEDDDIPFFFPVGAGIEEPSSKGLDAVLEEEEEEDDVENQLDEDEDMFGDVGGIQIVFTPPQADDDKGLDMERSPSPVKPPVPTFSFFAEDHNEESPVPFNFGRHIVSEPEEVTKNTVPSSAPSVLVTPPSSIPRQTLPRASSPSSIPRAMTIKPSFSFTDVTTSTPPKPAASRAVSASSAFVTPPNKRGGSMPSFIPQPVSSPSPMRSFSASSHPKSAVPSTTFIRQPQRKPLVLANNIKNQNLPSDAAHAPSRNRRAHPSTEMKSIDLSDHFNNNHISTVTATTHIPSYPHSVQARNTFSGSDSISSLPPCSPPTALTGSSSFSSIMSSPLAARLSLQTLTNFIPMSWSQRNDVPDSIASSSSSVIEAVPMVDDSEHGDVTIRAPVVIAPPMKRGFVAKEKQLEKLRTRLERESKMKMRTSVNVCCKKCVDELVFL